VKVSEWSSLPEEKPVRVFKTSRMGAVIRHQMKGSIDMPKKKPTHALIGEMQLGKSVEDVIKEHFSDYGLTADAREALPEIVREVLRINKKDLQFQVLTLEDQSWITILNAASDLCLEYWEYDDEDLPSALMEEAYEDCGILNEIVRRLYGVRKKRPKATLTEEEFAARNGEMCPYCKGNAVAVLDETGCERVITGCRECGATWEKTCRMVVTGFKYWRHGR
jgi:hypothetical protein